MGARVSMAEAGDTGQLYLLTKEKVGIYEHKLYWYWKNYSMIDWGAGGEGRGRGRGGEWTFWQPLWADLPTDRSTI